MKARQPFSFTVPLTIAIVSTLLVAGCRPNGKIPVNEDRAREHVISATTARDYTNLYRQGKVLLQRQITDSAYLNRNFDLPASETFNRDAIAVLLNQEGATGVRIYLGRDKNGQVRFILVPVDNSGKDIIKRLVSGRVAAIHVPGISSANAQDPNDGEVIEMGQRCPTLCDLTSVLSNSNPPAPHP